MVSQFVASIIPSICLPDLYRVNPSGSIMMHSTLWEGAVASLFYINTWGGECKVRPIHFEPILTDTDSTDSETFNLKYLFSFNDL